MRRLIHDEGGAVAVLVTVVMAVLIGTCALAVDAGRAYSAKREVQNGTDAAALAIAENCARYQNGDTSLQSACSNYATSASSYVSSNSPGASAPTATVDAMDIDTARAVTVHGARPTTFLFARILNAAFDASTISATSKAVWGPPKTMPALPVAANVNTYSAGGNAYIDLSSATQSGAFSWIDNQGNCQAKPISVGDHISFNDPGNSNPASGQSGCTPSNFQTQIALPIYGDGTGTGNNATYTILGFGVLDVYAYHFTGNGNSWCWQKNGTTITPALTCGGNQRAIWGKWVTYVAVGTPAASGSSLPFFGTIVISLVNP